MSPASGDSDHHHLVMWGCHQGLGLPTRLTGTPISQHPCLTVVAMQRSDQMV